MVLYLYLQITEHPLKELELRTVLGCTIASETNEKFIECKVKPGDTYNNRCKCIKIQY